MVAHPSSSPPLITPSRPPKTNARINPTTRAAMPLTMKYPTYLAAVVMPILTGAATPFRINQRAARGPTGSDRRRVGPSHTPSVGPRPDGPAQAGGGGRPERGATAGPRAPSPGHRRPAAPRPRPRRPPSPWPAGAGRRAAGGGRNGTRGGCQRPEAGANGRRRCQRSLTASTLVRSPQGPQGPARKGPIIIHCITGGQEPRPPRRAW